MQEIVFKPKNSAKVLVVGDIILDQYIYGETNRISPEAPVPVVRVDNTEERAGGAANVAINVSSLGVTVQLLGITGNDKSSERLQKILADKKVECHFVQQDDYPTITKQRVLSRHQQLIRLDYEKEKAFLDNSELIDRYQELIESVDIVILSDYAKGSLDKVQTLIKYANDKNVAVLVDPKSSDFSIYNNASIVTPNLKEFETVVGECKSSQVLIEKGNQLCKELKLDALLVTRGEKGMTLIRNNAKPFHLKAETHEVYDVTGAGDTVIAVLAAALACNSTLEQATTLANTAAGLVVEKLGSATVSMEELNGASINKYQSSISMDRDSVLHMINQAKRNGEQIVMTNGCFDILHMGHINYLIKAKSLGDRLIVAVNDDQSVKRLKGNSRPINPLKNRMTVLAALSCVDWVVPFNEDTPEELISLFGPDILVKGGDYTEEQIAGAEFVRKSGGDVIILPFEDGCSTTSMLEKLKTNT
ncbi:MAG: bifunctional D-glycero-beta-D-manno-heptose-7-phosphate kinase/D-glycero-beta-D-manno-heptose 1-phosphate adenylyltransferase HldE [Proteobacteria bacterium]|nr:bifunctional D-glycero-beta-D-manno-heptose-7-phosphate kinase/D-glycero-beta-D-manno-heptose 1-phosphate adenylyltransferase HldE [Pseudomonadota bacterium]NOG59205.1 bifunctional D-glycero-beta-D-manno-heptose-7-phosphate kinase/D-glycero-beta-D-manno-heptose 1-phosphate adenylyltransferase HldE [Pseudomonadota bacterium]